MLFIYINFAVGTIILVFMKKFSNSFLAILLVMCSCSSDDVKPDGGEPANGTETGAATPLATTRQIHLDAGETDALDSFTDISFDMLGKSQRLTDANGENNGNVSLSPVSAMICYSLLAQSVDEPYRTELVKALGFTGEEQLNGLSLKYMALLPADGLGVKASLANSIWLTDRYTADARFADTMREMMHVDVRSVDFSDGKAAASLINKWCSEHTGGLIKDFIDYVDRSTLGIWINALYFYGAWDEKFDRALTTREQFDGRDGAVRVPMMHARMDADYAAAGGFRYVAVPFDQNNYVLDLIIADDPEAELTADTYRALKYGASTADVELGLPRFDVKTELMLSDIYDGLAMAMENATLVTVGFPKSVTSQMIKIKHNTSFSVDEDGAEAAAVTGAFLCTSTGNESEPEHVSVTFDRPFYFAITHTETRAVVMLGRINNL